MIMVDSKTVRMAYDCRSHRAVVASKKAAIPTKEESRKRMERLVAPKN